VRAWSYAKTIGTASFVNKGFCSFRIMCGAVIYSAPAKTACGSAFAAFTAFTS
jgi:hypothetical protein